MRLTAEVAAPISGDKLYQQRARRALPLLVRQAESGEVILYSDLAEELGMLNARNLNFVLGSVGQTMANLSKAWKETVPPIQCLVVNKQTRLPGEGIGWFMISHSEYAKLPRARQRDIVKKELERVFVYSKWRDVLGALNLRPHTTDFSPLIEKASAFQGGEGADHKKLKDFVANHPEVVGLPATTRRGEVEAPLPSGDSLDVSFDGAHEWVAVEVKPIRSPIPDILRGLYQCIKYRAVMEAVQLTRARSRAARAILGLQGVLPQELVPIRNILGIEVVENISPK
jgi:hypothetical protein